jgi:hypothetical protein
MPPSTPHIVRAAEQAVQRLVAECRKGGPLYARNPKAAAQVNRTSRWLLNAIARLPSEADAACADAVRQ